MCECVCVYTCILYICYGIISFHCNFLLPPPPPLPFFPFVLFKFSLVFFYASEFFSTFLLSIAHLTHTHSLSLFPFLYLYSMVPIFLVSSVTGKNLDILRQFLNLLTSDNRDTEALCGLPSFLQVDETFNVHAVGPVVAGTLKQVGRKITEKKDRTEPVFMRESVCV